MGLNLMGPVVLVFIAILAVIGFGPGMKLIEYIFKKNGRTLNVDDPKGDATFRWVFFGGIALTFAVALIGRAMKLWGN